MLDIFGGFSNLNLQIGKTASQCGAAESLSQIPIVPLDIGLEGTGWTCKEKSLGFGTELAKLVSIQLMKIRIMIEIKERT